MKTTVQLCTAAILLLLLLTGCSTEHRSAATALAGNWDCTSAAVDGKALPEATVKKLRLTLTETQYRTEKGDEVLFDSTYTVDPSTNPKQINMVGTEGELNGKQAPGIYSLEADVLTLCYTMPGRPRPMRFESPTNSGVFLMTWKRRNAVER